MKKFIALLLALTIMCFSFVACDNSQTPDEVPSSDEQQVPKEKIELTLENWDTYFEFIEESFFTKDTSGKTDALRFRHYYKLKADYKIDLEKSNIEIKYKHSYCPTSITVNLGNETFKLGSATGEKKIIDERTINRLSMITTEVCAVLLFQPDKVTPDIKETFIYDDFELTEVKGTLYFINE